MVSKEEPASGVEELIAQVKQEGVDAGREEAERIVDEARAKAARILDEARTEASRMKQEAQDAAAREAASGQAALAQAARDATLRLQEALGEHFGRQLRRLVEQEFGQPEFLKRVVLELVGKERPAEAERAEVLLPQNAVGIEELRNANPKLGKDPVDAFVLDVARSGLRDGVTVRAADGDGVRLWLRNGEVEVEVSPESVTELLKSHLLPRFRGLLEGVYR